MKLLFVFVLLINSCNLKLSQKEFKLNALIFESLAESNKPIPVLIFRDSSAVIGHYMDVDSFIMDKSIINDIGDSVNNYCDSISLGKPRPLYVVTYINNDQHKIKYVNTDLQLRSVFDCLEAILQRKKFDNAYYHVHLLRRRLSIPIK